MRLDSGTGNSLSANSYESSYNSSSNHSYRGKAINMNNLNNNRTDALVELNGKPLIDGSSSSTLRLEMQSPDLAALSSDQSSSWYGVYNVNGTLPSNQRMIHEQEYEEIAI